MDEIVVQGLVHQAVEAAQFAREVRAMHAKRTPKGNVNRETDLRVALNRLKGVMRPIRSNLGRQKPPYEGRQRELRSLLLDTSDVLQRERRKLWKMQARKRKNSRGRR